MTAKRGFHDVMVYLDDFLVIGCTAAECHAAYNTLLQLLNDLRFQISMHKLVLPTQKLVFLGVQLDTLLCQMSLPQPKLRELQTLVSHFSTKRRASKKKLQQLAGKLNWACRVVFGGRTFLRRILDTMNSLTSSSAKCRLFEAFHLDIQWWKDFLAHFNSTRIFLDILPVVDVHTDACSVAAGAFFKGDWFYHNFLLDPPAHALLHINHKETLAIILAAKRWHQAWSNKHVIIHTVVITRLLFTSSTRGPLTTLSSWQNCMLCSGSLPLSTFVSLLSTLKVPWTQLQMLFLAFTTPHTCLPWTKFCHIGSQLKLTCRHHFTTTFLTIALLFCSPDLLQATLALNLQEEIFQYRAHYFAESTKSSYRTHHNTFAFVPLWGMILYLWTLNIFVSIQPSFED